VPKDKRVLYQNRSCILNNAHVVQQYLSYENAKALRPVSRRSGKEEVIETKERRLEAKKLMQEAKKTKKELKKAAKALTALAAKPKRKRASIIVNIMRPVDKD
jgi:hypothetical protein